MKIFQVNDKFFREGGTEVYIRQISRSLKKIGHEIIIVYGEGPHPKEVAKEGYQAYQIPGIGEPHSKTEEEALAKIKEIVTVENPDVINIHNIQNAKVVDQFHASAPTMRYVHDHRLYCPGFSKTWYESNQICPIPFSFDCLVNAYKEHCATRRPTRLLQKFHDKFYELDVNRKLPRLLLASNYMTSQLLINKFDPKTFVVLPDMVELPAKITTPQAGRNILFVGRLTIEKGLQYLIDAMTEIPDAVLTVVGVGPQLADYRASVKKKGLGKKVLFAGEVSRKEIGDYYIKSNVVAFTSIWPEPHGKIGPEAFSYARAVVGFDSGGVKEWLKDGEFGYLIPRLDTQSLAKKINFLLDNPRQAAKMGLKARKWVEAELSEENYLKNLVKIYQDTSRSWQKEKVFI